MQEHQQSCTVVVGPSMDKTAAQHKRFYGHLLVYKHSLSTFLYCKNL